VARDPRSGQDVGLLRPHHVIDNKQDNWFVGASMPWGQWTLRASYGHVERSGTDPDNVEGQKADQLPSARCYWLSSVTAFYGTYSNLNNKGVPASSSAASANVAGGGAAANGDLAGAEFGVMHRSDAAWFRGALPAVAARNAVRPVDRHTRTVSIAAALNWTS